MCLSMAALRNGLISGSRMSDKQVKAERSKIKDFKQMPAFDLPSNGTPKKKRDKPWIVEEKYSDEYLGEMASWGNPPPWANDGWRVRGRYVNEAIAHAAVAQFESQITGGHLEYRVKHREDGDE